MTDTEIVALAKGMVPFVRQCVSEATELTPEINKQVANSIRLMNELPPLDEHHNHMPARSVRIDRDDEGNFIPVYDD